MTKKLCMGIVACLLLASCQPNEKKQAETTETEATEAAVGQLAPDFTLNSPEGLPISLSDLRGRYVVLDFWGTWCKWCIKGIPDMKAYYEKYEGDFEMLSIDFGDDEDKWLNAIEKYKMGWLHVITDEESAEQLQTDYGIEGFPTKMVVDPDGKIIHITVGEDPAFYKFLDELFGEG